MNTLIDPAGLHAVLNDRRPPVVLDVRWSLDGPPGRGLYDAGHIPGARFCDLETVASAEPAASGEGGRHPLPSAEAATAAMRELGVSHNSTVVVYDQVGGFGAARLWWCLRYWGHEDVAVLDGGYRAWVETGFTVNTELPSYPPGDFTARPGGMPLLDAEAAAELARSSILLDARAGGRYRGEEEPIDPVAGHIPGAASAPTTENAQPDGRFRSGGELKDRFAALGVDGSAPVGVYCGSGVSAAHEVLALSLIGVPAALYVGSWSDWTSDPSRPVATGPEPG